MINYLIVYFWGCNWISDEKCSACLNKNINEIFVKGMDISNKGTNNSYKFFILFLKKDFLFSSYHFK